MMPSAKTLLYMDLWDIRAQLEAELRQIVVTQSVLDEVTVDGDLAVERERLDAIAGTLGDVVRANDTVRTLLAEALRVAARLKAG